MIPTLSIIYKKFRWFNYYKIITYLNNKEIKIQERKHLRQAKDMKYLATCENYDYVFMYIEREQYWMF